MIFFLGGTRDRRGWLSGGRGTWLEKGIVLYPKPPCSPLKSPPSSANWVDPKSPYCSPSFPPLSWPPAAQWAPALPIDHLLEQ